MWQRLFRTTGGSQVVRATSSRVQEAPRKRDLDAGKTTGAASTSSAMEARGCPFALGCRFMP